MGDAAALIAASSPGPGTMAALNALGGARRATIGALAVGALWPLCSLKSLARRAGVRAGTGGVLYTAGFMAKRCLDGTYAAGGRFAKECGVATFGDTLGFGSVNLGVYLAMCGTAYMAHFNAPSFFQDAGKKMKPYNAVIRNGFGLSILLNIAFMAAGFNTFGKGAKGLVLNNYATTTDALRRRRQRALRRNMFAKTDATLEKAVVGVPLALITAIALVVDDAGVVAALTGALMGSAVIYALPALMLLKGDKVAKAGWEKKIAPFAMLAMGAVGAVLGVVTP
ncbi:Transmembrane amino acid transporter protein [Aureococcus anophagefferens]|uniref:Transmembrane amino acid transporter protein n=1 Tax=Aureococcus anophagefferens TaxID=44056 RepID=A0ABR1FTB0_AURAN